MRMRVAPELVPMIDELEQVLRGQYGPLLGVGGPQQGARNVKRSAGADVFQDPAGVFQGGGRAIVERETTQRAGIEANREISGQPAAERGDRVAGPLHYF